MLLLICHVKLTLLQMRLYIYKLKPLFLLAFFALLFANYSFGQLTVTPSGTAASLTATLAGPGVTIISDTLICNTTANGTFTSVATPIALPTGIILCTGHAVDASGPETGLTSTNFGGPGDPDLTSLLGSTTISVDGCALIINFVPKGDTVSFRYQFGSEEYRNAVCSSYNDAFAFFIAGPGVSTTLPGVNMALVPGTNVPVAVNTVNNGIPGTVGGCNIANCTAYGSGSPFTAYYIDNTGGTSVSYRGYTDVFVAKHWVIPCDTYRIKMAIVDGGNGNYDSGVFIEGGSLKTNTYHFDRTDSVGITLMGIPHSVVKGCSSDTLNVQSFYPVTSATTLHLTYGGTATSGVDYAALPDSVIIPAGDSSVALTVTGLITPPVGVKTLTIYLTSASSCGNLDSFTINIIDHPAATILTQDTSICSGSSVQIMVNGTTGLTYSWSPATFLDNSTLMDPTATPTVSTTYIMTATLQGSACASITESINISVIHLPFTILTPDTSLCQGSSLTIRVNGSDSLVYSWSPGTGLSSAVVMQPIASPTVTTTYTLTGTYPALGCSNTETVTITVIPMNFAIATIDTYMCEGATINLNASVSPPDAYTYLWTGPNGYSSVLLNPAIAYATALFVGTYHLTVTNPGGCSRSANEYINVFPNPGNEIIHLPISICQYSPAMPLQINGYNDLMWYSSPTDTTPTVFAPVVQTDSPGMQQFYAAQISFKSNCIGQRQEVDVDVINCCNGVLFVPSAFTPNNDGKNDILRVVKSNEYVVDEFDVYNRWGERIFHTEGEQQGWDGTFNGAPADLGTYYYELTASCINAAEKSIIKKGSVTLIR